jgi:YebC/PmpR family DNA-binding regulatory protein
MAGHSKWANIKHRKERSDKKKGKIYSRAMKEIISAIRQAGPDLKTNHKLRIAVQKAKDVNVPNEVIDRNIKKANSSDQQDFVEMSYELYGYGGVGIIADVMTDNKNRIASDMRIATNKCGGTVATPGAVSYNFDRKGHIRVAKTNTIVEDDLFLLVSEHGADDFSQEEDFYIICTPISAFYEVKDCIEKSGISCEEAQLAMIPKVWVDVTDEDADKNIALIEWLENLDDVDAIYHNMRINA